MGHQHLRGGPCENALQRVTPGAAVGEGDTKLARHRRFGAHHKVQFRHQRSLAGEQAHGKLLDQIGKENGAAAAMEEYQLRRDKIALHEDLIDLAGPIRAWRISEIGIEDNVLALLSQSWRGVDLGSRIGALPLQKKQVVK